MKIVVESRQAGAADALAEFIRRKLERGLRPYRADIARVELRTGGHGPTGSTGACCRLQIQVRNASTVRAAEVHPNLSVAVDRVCQRAMSLVARQMESSRSRKPEGRTSGMQTPGYLREAHPLARATWRA